MQNNQSQFN